MPSRYTKLIYDDVFQGGDPLLDTVHGRVAYYMRLDDKWVYTEFDAWSRNPLDYGKPTRIQKRWIKNLTIRSNVVREVKNASGGHIEWSPNNYSPGGNGSYDTSDTLVDTGGYGCMQLHVGEDVIWAWNQIHGNGEMGIGNNTSNSNKDWTFTNNGASYSRKTFSVYSINTVQETVTIKTLGVAHGDPLVFNYNTQTWGQTLIPYTKSNIMDEPNFVIALTGQSNSQGMNAWWDSENPQDQPHDRIFGFNDATGKWEQANLNTESLGTAWHKPLGTQSLAFHFARRLVEAYPDIRPGIVNLGIGGQPIARWAKFEGYEGWFTYNAMRASTVGSVQGDIYDLHVNKINNAMDSINAKSIDVILWHQGETDGDTESTYYMAAIKKVIEQYRSLPYCSPDTPFVVGETTGAHDGINQGWEKRNVELKALNIDSDPRTRCIDSSDLPTSHYQYNNGDQIHFSAIAQRTMGTRYFRAFRSMFE